MGKFANHVKQRGDGVALKSSNGEIRGPTNLRVIADIAKPIIRDSKSNENIKTVAGKYARE